MPFFMRRNQPLLLSSLCPSSPARFRSKSSSCFISSLWKLAAKILNNGDFSASRPPAAKKSEGKGFLNHLCTNFARVNNHFHMKWSELFTSSVGKKFVMGLTGVFLVLFLIVHVGVNACIWAMDGGQMFNMAAHFLGSTVVMRVLEIGLFLGFILHIVQAYVLELQNRRKRGVGYRVPMGNRGSRWYTRYMGWLGTFILLFLVIHLKNFWIPSRFDMPEDYRQIYNGVE